METNNVIRLVEILLSEFRHKMASVPNNMPEETWDMMTMELEKVERILRLVAFQNAKDGN